ncbi:MAG: glycosyltransferase [Acidobacteria bacterium]|nr:glycosyltransferase [Acidobacteriota bacterium]
MRSRLMALAAGAVLSGAFAALAVDGADPPSRSEPLAALPERPRARVALVPGVAAPGPVRVVRAGDSLQAALDAAQPGDVLALEPGATFRGPFTLPAKPGAEWITIRSAAPDSSLKPPGTRVTPADAGAMPKLESASAPVFTAAPGAHHYRFVALEVRPRPGAFLHNLVVLGLDETDVEAQPHHVVFERCYLHGDPRRGTRRGIALNGRDLAVVDSHLSDFKEAGADSQAIAGWGGAGPFRIENNTLEAAGENVLFGGADPRIRDLVPSDIEIRRNHLSKPVSWKPGEPGYEGTLWTVKNLFELKNARRVLVEGNVLENNWVHAQSGFAVLFTVRNQDGSAPWSVVEDVTFASNVVRHAAAGVNVLGRDDNAPSGRTQRLAIVNNLFVDVGGEGWGGSGTLLQMLDGAADVLVAHNTAFNSGNVIVAEGVPHTGFVLRDTIAVHGRYGIVGTGTAPGRGTLDAYFPGSILRRNVLVGGAARLLPPDNFTPASLDEVGFVNWREGDYRLAAGSAYRGKATDGGDVGVDVAALVAAQEARPEDLEPPRRERVGPEAAAVTPGTRPRPRAAVVAFWTAALLLAYTHLGYPLLIRVWAALRPRPARRGAHVPDVSLLIVARDESGRIDARLGNVFALDYPPSRLEVVLASDGSTDGTVERARVWERAGVRVVAYPAARGKPSVLDDLVPQCRGEIVVLADARQRFDERALRALVAPFADPDVGAVSGELVLTRDGRPGAVGEGVGMYWRMEKAIRYAESVVDSSVGATGAIYALRRDLYEPIPADTLLDDVLIPLRLVRRGWRVVFEPGARAFDRAPTSAAEELARKARTIAGNFQLFAREAWLLDPLRNRLWLQTVSHKALRLLTPGLLAVTLLATLCLAGDVFYGSLLAAQAFFYAAAAAGHVAGGAGRATPFLSVPYVVCLLAWATVVGFFRFLTGRQPVTWAKPSLDKVPSCDPMARP